jgi:uncharacterized membrane protein
MATAHHIRNPFEMAVEQVGAALAEAGRVIHEPRPYVAEAAPAVRKIAVADLWTALREGFGDLGVVREDVAFAALIYPIAGLLLADLLLNHNLVPLIFPLASGFAILGPVAAIGLYEISRRHEQARPVTLAHALGVFRSPAIGSIFALSLILVGVFVLWLGVAYGIYTATLGPAPPAPVGAFAREVFLTPAGWTMIAVGVGVGFLFAVLALALSVVSFPLLLDRDGGLGRAVATSVRAVTLNPVPMAVWGAVIAAGLLIGSLPALFGLIFVVPLFGHATWRLYRRLIADA